MLEIDYSVLRCHSIKELNSLLEKHSIRGWKPVGYTDYFNGEFVQAIEIAFDLDDTQEITLEVTQQNITQSMLTWAH